MISIVFKNVKNLYEKQYLIGMRLNRTSSCYVKGFSAAKKTEIYLQRGYRQYGLPLVNLFFF